MGLSKSKSKTETKQSGTTTPTVAPWMAPHLQDFAGNVSGLMDKPGSAYIAGSSPLQDQAFASAANLGGGNQALDDAIGMAKTAGAAPAASYTAPTLGGPATVDLQGYTAPTVGNVNLGAANLSGSESLMDGFDRYLDPATQQLVDAALRNYDASSGKSAAALEAQQARTGAFGGSRAGIAQGEFAASTDRQRALTEGELRARAFSQAAQMADADAGRRQSTNFFNTGAMNTRDLTQGGFDMQRIMAQAGLDADAARFGADAANQGSMFNAGNQNQFDLAQAGMDATAGQFNASAEEQAMQRALEAAGLVGSLGTAQSADARADVGLQADIGAAQRAIEQAQLMADPALLQLVGSLYGSIPAGTYTGQQINSSGTSTTKESPSLFGMLMQLGNKAASAYAMGS